MKWMFAGDIHGSSVYCQKMLDAYERENAGMLVLLGDILYHGPRNDLPEAYAPKQVITMLNEVRCNLLAVRGNCDTEVDQMVLDFPIMADYAVLYINDKKLYVTHGHIHNEENLPPIQSQDVLIHGHTHLPEAKCTPNCYILNPGSISIPKNNFPHSYATLEENYFQIKDFNGQTIKEIQLL